MMKRYPGIRPFRTDEQALFFGRDADIERLYRLIDLEQLVILYGKSGYGKSSLLSAGIFPRLQQAGKRRFWEIRLGPHKPGESQSPADNARMAVQHGATGPVLVPDGMAGPSLWQALKNAQAAGGGSFLLVFDQFEELFTYPPEQILEFKKQLSEALRSTVPKTYEAALAKAGLPPEQEDAFYTPFDLKVVFSIRSDRMSLLNGLKDYLPNLLQHSYELQALDESAARAAILNPAALPQYAGPADGEPVFDTPPFTYTEGASQAVFAALRNDDGRIETSALQIVCRYAEDYVAGTKAQQVIQAEDLGDIKLIFRAFYERTIDALPPGEKDPARRLVEDHLIKDGVRIPYAAQALLALPGVTSALLERLSAASLLRVQRDEQGRMIYEVGHDTLVAPISEAAQARREREEKERLQAEAEKAQREKDAALKARRRARAVAVGAILLAVVAVGASIWAWRQTLKAERQTEIAEEQSRIAKEQTAIAVKEKTEAEAQRIKADSSARIAQEQTLAAERAEKAAQQNLEKAKQEEAKAKALLLQVGKEKSATEEQRRIAEENYRLAQEKTKAAEEAAEQARKALTEVEIATAKVVQNLLRDAAAFTYRLDYEEAKERQHDAADLVAKKDFDTPLGRLRPAAADSIMELAWYYAETGNYVASQFEMAMIASVLGVPDPSDALQDAAGSAQAPEQKRRARAAFREALRQLRPAAFDALDAKYYPVMLSVPGGTFHPGEDGENYEVTLSGYKLARTETTVWQYNLYLAEQGKDIFDDKIIPRPGWGWEGDNPMVNVSWFDACLYANWLSGRFGLKEVYDINGRNITPDTTAKGFRLPTEAEWEFAARGGPEGLRENLEYAGNNTLDLVGWFGDNSGNRARAVAQKWPNRLGLYDMSGNVWEWCWDWYGGYPEGSFRNPRGPEQGVGRVNRGGGWVDGAGDCRVSDRVSGTPDGRSSLLGFRLVSSPPR